jgi:hypothetical protein
MGVHHTPQTLRLQRKLERWELEHLRELATQQCLQIEAQATRIADLERELGYSQDSLDFWHGHALDLGNALHAKGGQVCLTQAGELRVQA